MHFVSIFQKEFIFLFYINNEGTALKMTVISQIMLCSFFLKYFHGKWQLKQFYFTKIIQLLKKGF